MRIALSAAVVEPTWRVLVSVEARGPGIKSGSHPRPRALRDTHAESVPKPPRDPARRHQHCQRRQTIPASCPGLSFPRWFERESTLTLPERPALEMGPRYGPRGDDNIFDDSASAVFSDATRFTASMVSETLRLD